MNRILWNRRPPDDPDKVPSIDRAGDIDEIVLTAKWVHVEQMTDRCWWIGVTLPDGGEWMGNFWCDSRGRMRFSEQEMSGFIWDKDDTHESPDPTEEPSS